MPLSRAVRLAGLIALPPLVVAAVLVMQDRTTDERPDAATAWHLTEEADRTSTARLRQRVGCGPRAVPPAATLGARFEGLPRTGVQRRCARGDARSPDVGYTAAYYGSCPLDERPCPVPVEVQTWPACHRHPGAYVAVGPDSRLPFARRLLGGRLAAVYERGLRIEVLAGDRTVVVFGTDAGRVARAAARLRSRTPLAPRPDAGILAGRVRCVS